MESEYDESVEEMQNSGIESDGDDEKMVETTRTNLADAVTKEPLITWSRRKSVKIPLSPFSPIGQVSAPKRLPMNVPVYQRVESIDDISSDDEADPGEDTRTEIVLLRHYWEELEEQNETISTWLTCHSCGKRRKANRAHPYLRGLKDYFYCGNGLRPTENRCGRPCTWISSNIGQEAAIMLGNHNIHKVEDLLFNKTLEQTARSLGVVFEPQTLR